MTITPYTRPQKLLTELLGTYFLVAVCTGFARFGNLWAAVSYGIAYGALIAALGRVSGGHFNPAVSTAHWSTHRFGPFDALTYIFAQVAGAIAAAYTLRIAFPNSVQFLGPPMLGPDTTRGPAMLIEAAMTLALVLSLWTTVVDRKRPRWWLGGIASAISIAIAVFFGAPYTGAALNPARAIGPAVAAHQWAYQPVYWIGPLAGAVLAASLYDLLFHRKRAALAAPVASRKHHLMGY
jgi:aquaporin Z